jgi:hypothetical protein
LLVGRSKKGRDKEAIEALEGEAVGVSVGADVVPSQSSGEMVRTPASSTNTEGCSLAARILM